MKLTISIAILAFAALLIYNAAAQQPSKFISGVKFNDLDGNGRQTIGESGLLQWEIQLYKMVDSDFQLVDKVFTGIDGSYIFDLTDYGTYKVIELQQEGWSSTTPFGGYKFVTIDSCNPTAIVNFGNWQTSQISGHKYHDINGDGDLSDGIPLEGWTIELFKDRELINTTTTNENGYYSFTNLVPGRYSVKELLQSGWTQTYPASGSYRFLLDQNSLVEPLDFGNYPEKEVSGHKYHDLDGDGDLIDGIPLEGWTIELYLNGQLINTTTTDENGAYSFSNLGPGSYKVKEVLQSGWVQTYPASESHTFLLDGNRPAEPLDFGNCPENQISGHKYHDLNGDGDLIDGIPLKGWTIELYKNGELVDTTVTDENGAYSFTNLDPGRYEVREILQSGWIQTYPESGNHSFELDVALPTGPLDFGNFMEMQIFGHKYHDINGDGILIDDPPLEGWTIELYKNGELAATTTTDENGTYYFTNLGPGSYDVKEELPPGWTQTFPSTGSYTFELGAVPPPGPLDFGNDPEISGHKYNDLDGDGDLNDTILPLEGWTIELYLNGEIMDTTTTDENGFYSFMDLESGSYEVREVQQPEWTQTYPPTGSYIFELGPISLNEFDFANWREVPLLPYTLSGYKFYDRNNNSVWDVDERVLSDWTIFIDMNNNGQLDNGDLSTVTDADGYYVFEEMNPGTYIIREILKGDWIQTTPSGGFHQVDIVDVDVDGINFGNYIDPLDPKKEAEPKVVSPGDEITYTISICNRGPDPLTNVTVGDVFDRRIDFVSASPMPSSDGLWHIDVIGANSCYTITLVVRVPVYETKFSMEQAVSGEGFVNVFNDYDTTRHPYIIKNCVHVISDETTEVYDCENVTVLEGLGTELRKREHGSGDYITEELTRYLSKNNSIEVNKSLSAVYHPTTFSLPKNRSLNYSLRWIEKSKAKNFITGASMTEEYTFGNRLDRDSSTKLDKNGSSMMIEAAFEGVGHIGVLKKANSNSTARELPIFESREDYTGSFEVFENVEEYGKNVVSDKSVSGTGLVVVDKRIRDSQRTYESGTGTYDSEEQIRTHTSYIAKDLKAVHSPVNYSYTKNTQMDSDLKWKGGIWSKSRNTSLKGGGLSFSTSINNRTEWGYVSLIAEEFSSADYLEKETIAKGLNEMDTKANFSGKAVFRTIMNEIPKNRSLEIDLDEEYIGDYSVSRSVLLMGVAKYDTPHLSVAKEGRLEKRRFNRVNATIAEYTITVQNDGNRALGPIYVSDFFPQGTEYIDSSVKPTELTSSYAEWTLTHLAIGAFSTIDLRLNVTGNSLGELVNIVEAAGGYNDTWITANNFSATEMGWLTCCPSEIWIDKIASLDPTTSIVKYRLIFQNLANRTLAAKVTDRIPDGLILLNSSVKPTKYEQGQLEWTFPGIRSGKIIAIDYSAKAIRDGIFTNRAYIEAYSKEGYGSAYANASSSVVVIGTSEKPLVYGDWQVPDWGFDTSEEGLCICS